MLKWHTHKHTHTHTYFNICENFYHTVYLCLYLLVWCKCNSMVKELIEAIALHNCWPYVHCRGHMNSAWWSPSKTLIFFFSMPPHVYINFGPPLSNWGTPHKAQRYCLYDMTGDIWIYHNRSSFILNSAKPCWSWSLWESYSQRNIAIAIEPRASWIIIMSSIISWSLALAVRNCSLKITQFCFQFVHN